MSDKISGMPVEYLFTPEDLEKQRAVLRKEEQDAKGLLQKMNLAALKALCVLYDNKVGDYPENEYEGDSFWEYVKNLNTQVEKETKDLKKENIGKVLFTADYDEWYGPVYTCPFCDAEKLWDDYKFCPCCGGNLEGFRFETREEDEKRMKKGGKMKLEEISELRKRLSLDDFELQLIMHHMRIPPETLKRRYSRARSGMGRLLIKNAIKYKEEVMRNDN